MRLGQGDALRDLVDRLDRAAFARERHAQRVEGVRPRRGCLARALGVGRGLLVGRRFGQRFLGPRDGAGVVAGSKCEPTDLLEQLRALDRIAILAEPLEARRETGAGALAIAGLPMQSADLPVQPRGAGAISSRLELRTAS